MTRATVIVTLLLAVAVLAVQDLPNLSRPGQWVLRLRNSTHPRLVEQEFGIKAVRPLLIHQNVAGENERFFLFDDIEGRLHEGLFSNHPHISWARFQPLLNRGKRSTLATSSAAPNDPLWAAQWYLHGTNNVDLNVTGVWDMGINGRGIVISIVDDGIDYKHAEFTGRYCAECSYDVNFSDDDPSPYSWDIHGTASASTAVSAANNYKCNVGVAPGAKVAGIRLLAADTTDFQEAEALGYALDKVDIYSNSWGPYDDGKTLEGPGELTLATLKNGVETGRDGKGAVYVWAGGNGNEQQDSCNYDGYANSRFTIAIGAIGKNGIQTYYSERCAALIAVTPSSDKQGNQVSTAMAYGECYTRFGGTSASSPMAAGAVALILQANPLLTWRDVQGVLIRSSVPVDLNNADWSTNAAGLRHNYRYGFGRIDAYAAVALAKNWDLLSAYVNTSSPLVTLSKAIPDKSAPVQYVTSTVNLVDEGDDFIIEHVEVVFSAEHSRRGDLLIELVSPSQTVSTLAWTHSDSSANYSSWRFSSIRHWGESSGGSWTLRVSDGTTTRTGVFKSWQLFVYGHK